jgi:hypothetical protein
MSPSTYNSGRTELDGAVEGPHGTLVISPRSSVDRLSSIPLAPGHKSRSPASLGDPTYAGLSRSVTLPVPLRDNRGRFQKHFHAPYTSCDRQVVPPSGAPGYAREGGWGTGGSAVDWERGARWRCSGRFRGCWSLLGEKRRLLGC